MVQAGGVDAWLREECLIEEAGERALILDLFIAPRCQPYTLNPSSYTLNPERNTLIPEP